MPMSENEIRKEVNKVETQFLTDAVTVIMYLNKNGVRLNLVRQILDMKIQHAFDKYEKMCEELDDVLGQFRHYHQRKI